MTDNLTPLNAAIKRHGDTPFPSDTADQQLSELHAELVEYDGYVIGLAQKVAGHIWVEANDLRPDEILRERLIAATSSASGHAQRSGLAYLDYLDEIDDILELARRARG